MHTFLKDEEIGVRKSVYNMLPQSSNMRLFSFLNYKSMIKFAEQFGKCTTKLHIVTLHITIFKVNF